MTGAVVLCGCSRPVTQPMPVEPEYDTVKRAGDNHQRARYEARWRSPWQRLCNNEVKLSCFCLIRAHRGVTNRSGRENRLAGCRGSSREIKNLSASLRHIAGHVTKGPVMVTCCNCNIFHLTFSVRYAILPPDPLGNLGSEGDEPAMTSFLPNLLAIPDGRPSPRRNRIHTLPIAVRCFLWRADWKSLCKA
jgi:hypothetical protein